MLYSFCRRYTFSAILLFAAGLSLTLPTDARGGILDEFERTIERVDKERGRAERRLKKEVDRWIRDAKEELERAERKVQKIEREIRRVRDDIYKVASEIPYIGEQVVELVEEVESIATDSARQVSITYEMIGKADKIISGNMDEINISIDSFGSVLAGKISKKVSSGDIDNFLQAELAGDLKVIHFLMPIQAIREEIDPTQMSRCVRMEATNSALSGLSASAFLNIDQSISIEDEVKKVVVECVKDNFLEKISTSPSDAEISEIEQRAASIENKRKEVLSEIEENEELKAKEEQYREQLKVSYEKQMNNLRFLEQKKSEAAELQLRVEEKNKELKTFLASLESDAINNIVNQND